MADQSKFTKKVSPLIEGQVPDFVQADHPVFVDFVKDYFQFLEAGRLTLTQTINYIVQETASTSYVLDEQDGERIVTEIGEGTLGQFVVGETVTGGTSKATAKVIVEDSRNTYLYITGQQKFINGETITGGTSNSTATVNEYRGNPIQNIQQMLEYANVDNTLFDFLDQMRDQFLVSIPENLATGLDKRKLIKNIKDLYSAKGTSEGHKLFMRMLLDESSEIFYPNQYMMRLSNAEWSTQTLIRVIPIGGSTGDEIVNQLITGGTSGATAIVESAVTTQQQNETFNDSVTTFQISNVVGTFTDDETITATSTARDVTVSFTVKGIVADTTVTNDGILHSDTESIAMETIGNAFATVVVDGIAEGSVSKVIVDDVGTSYEVGDTIGFTANSADESTSAATGFVSMIGGGILQEGTTSDTILIEDGSTTHLEEFKVALETTESDSFLGDGTTTTFSFTNLNGETDGPLYLTIDDIVFPQFKKDGSTQWSVSATQIIFSAAPADRVKIYIRGQDVDFLLLDGTDIVDTVLIDAGHNVLTDTVVEKKDTHTTSTDQIVLEFDTFEDIDSTSTESGSIQKTFITDGGGGYTKLPTVSVSKTISGSGTKLISTTTNIGAAKSMKITDSGFRYSSTNPPDAIFRAHFVLKDVTGTFVEGSTLTTHTGVVKGWDSTTQVLDTTFENVIRLQQEQSGTFNEGIQLEQGNLEHMPSGVLLEDEQDFDDGVNIILDGTGTTTPSPQTITFKIKVIYDADLERNIFYVQDEAQPILTLFEGNTYIFDLSDSSLYNSTASLNHSLKFSETSNGTHGGGSEYTTGVTTSVAAIEIGTTGAFIQIVVATSAPTLFYYCANHSGMGNQANTSQYVTTVDNAGGAVIFDSTDHGPNIEHILLESGVVGRKDTDIIILEDNSGAIFLEETIIGQLADVGDNLLIDRYRENKNAGSQFIILEEDGGGRLSTEDFGDSLILNNTAAAGQTSEDVRDKILLSDETGNGNVVLDGTDSLSVDAASNIINESPIDFSGENVTITDSNGGSGTIVTADIATGTTSVATTSTTSGQYNEITNRLGEDLVRIQDSYYYQDYSYEVQIGQSFASYINEMKKAVHPAGFQPFGRVTLATLVSAGITNTAAGVSDYTGDTKKFTPILASVLETIFSQVLQSRLQVPTTHTADGQVAIGSRDNSFIQEDGFLPGETFVINGDGGTETAQGGAASGNAGYGTIRAGAEYGGKVTVDIPQKIILNGTDGSSTDAGDNITLDGTDADGSNAGSSIEHESFGVFTTQLLVHHVFNFKGNDFSIGSDALLSQNTGSVLATEGELTTQQRIAPYFDRVSLTVADEDNDRFAIEDTQGNFGISVDGSLKMDLWDQFPDNVDSFTSNGPNANVGAREIALMEAEGFSAFGPFYLFGSIFRQYTTDVIGLALTLSEPVRITNDIVLTMNWNAGERLLFEENHIELEDGGNLLLNSNGVGIDRFVDGVSKYMLEDASSDVMMAEDGFNAIGDSILFEAATITSDNDTTSGTGDGAGKFMLETSHATSDKMDRAFVKQIVTKITARPSSKRTRNMLIYLAETPFGNENGGDGIQLETAVGGFGTGNILIDGTLPLDQTTTFTELERNTIGDNILLDGTSGTAANAGDSLLLETGFVLVLERESLGVDAETFRILNEDDDGSKTSRILQEGGEWNFPLNFASNIGSRILLDENTNEETIPLSHIGHFQFSDILRREKFIINDGEDTGIQMEDAGQILLDASDANGTDAGHHLVQETTKRNRFDLEQNGALVVEHYDTASQIDLLLDENNDNIVFEDNTENSFWGSRGLNNVINFGIKLEYGEGTILLDSHGGDTSIDLGESDQLLLEEDFTIPTVVALESTNKIISKGQIPLRNFSLNSNEILRGYDPIVRSADINVKS